ncbi:glycosyltransferase [Rheinheimera aquimaris]|uniref:glycosyltransferase n=1 Tax=Rheinheimera aquimaris TaxID=412437 RepID=UPI0023EA5D4F|nr:glycosyltransferase [Rheinheimera aquimaris]
MLQAGPLERPLVTIYIATQNRPQMLKRAVLSCISQTYSPLEVIVVDDGSEEINAQKNQKLLADYPQVKYIRLPQPAGAPVARNTAINLAQGEFITGLDDDDEFTPERVSEFVTHWYRYNDYGFLCTGYTVIAENMQRFEYGAKARTVSYSQLLYANVVGNQVFTLTSTLRAIGGFDPSLPSCQDYDTWLRLAAAFGKGYRINSTSYILHQEHQSGRISASEKRETGYKLLLEKHRQYMTPAQLASHQVNFALYNNSVFPWIAFLRLPPSQSIRVIKTLLVRKGWHRFRFGRMTR